MFHQRCRHCHLTTTVSLLQVVAELRVLNIEPDDYTLEPDKSKDKFL